MDVNDWPTRLKGCRTSATGTLRDVLNLASGRDVLKLAAHDGTAGLAQSVEHRARLHSERTGSNPVPGVRVSMLASSPVPAPGATPPRREHFLGLDCE